MRPVAESKITVVRGSNMTGPVRLEIQLVYTNLRGNASRKRDAYPTYGARVVSLGAIRWRGAEASGSMVLTTFVAGT